ncbi:hypothetical protein BDN72DRAFT_863182, partial [Pluteus cervinus]
VNDYPPNSWEHCAPWIVVTEICHHWRDVALESTILWSHIPRSYSKRIIERCLKVSKSAPLVVNIHGCMTRDQIYPSFKDPEVISRLRCLEIRLSDPDSSFQELCSLLSSTAPLLESLSIELSWMDVQNEHSPIVAVSDFLKVHVSARLDFGAFTPTKVEFMTFCGRLKLNLVDGRKTLSWPIISSTFPGLERLSIEGVRWAKGATLFRALIEDSQTRSSSPWIPIFPRLLALHLQDITIDDECKEKLVRVLQDRKEVGSALEKIGADGCDQIDDKFLDLLGVVEGLSVTRCRCDGMTEEERDLYMDFAEDLDGGELMCSDPRYHVRSYMEDDDM